MEIKIKKSFDAKLQQFDKWDFRTMEFRNFQSRPPDAFPLITSSDLAKYTVFENMVDYNSRRKEEEAFLHCVFSN